MALIDLFVGLCFVHMTTPTTDRFASLGEAVEKSIAARKLPGCVVVIVHRDQVVYRRAFGNRRLHPTVEKMSADTIFDLASLTKPVATATLIAQLVEQGRIHWDDPIARHWPEFAAAGKGNVTIEQCLLHTSGLIADNPLSDYQGGPAAALARIAQLKCVDVPGTRFRYSDVGYIVLGHLIERVTKESLSQVASKRLFDPLKMVDTSFQVSKDKLSRTAPTDRDGTEWRTGVVHDPRARALGGPAGHAGLFSTADDLARFCRMLLRRGELEGVRILMPATVDMITQPIDIGHGLRTRGWDCDTSYSRNRGTVFPKGRSFGHTGFTGTSLWLDPESQTAVIFLSNRVHPDDKGDVGALRGEVATLAAHALGLYNK
jgi:CubicO group peptidase (beta-lactamase class C family)